MTSVRSALLAAAAMIACMGGTAQAQTWDAFSSFSLDNNDDPASPFRYVVGGRLATQKNASCMDGQGQCVLDAEIAFAGVYKPAVTGEWLTIGIDASTLFMHPAYVDPTAIVFVAPKEGTYRFSGGFRIIDHYPTGVIVSWGAGQKLLSQPNESTSFLYERHLDAGQSVAFSVDPNGDYGYDSTAVAVQATYVGSDAAAWQAGQWAQWSTTCGQATRTRTVSCVNARTGSPLSDASCTAGDRPSATETSYQTSGCSYAWEPGAWGSPAPACGATVSSRTVSCRRSDGVDATDAQCAGVERPATEMAATDYSTCSYSWAADAWSAPSSTCGAATETRAVYCQRSDGTRADDASCSGTAPDTTRASYQTSGCTFAWEASPTWDAPVPACGQTVQNRLVSCRRSDGQVAADASCDAASKPASQRSASDYSTCGFSWEAGAWSAPTRTCGSSTRTRTVSCLRSDGAAAPDGSCVDQRPDAVETVADYSTCTAAWRYSDWSAPAPACGATTSARTAECVREDGAAIDAASCGAQEPLSRDATDYSSCSFSWRAGEWNSTAACGVATRTRQVDCVRSDGTPTTADRCDAAQRPASSEPISDTSGCRYDWVQTGLGQWSTCQDGSQSRSISVQCRRSDGAVAADTLCGGTRPASQETRSCGSTPVTPPSQGGMVIFRRQLEARR